MLDAASMQEHSSPPLDPSTARGARLALAISIALAWVNLAMAGRWASEPGALHGWRLLPYGAALAATSWVLAVAWRRTSPMSGAEARIAGLLGTAILVGAFLAAFPPGVWNEVPFHDDWPGLMQLTLNGIATLREGAIAGWHWAFLGGYPTSADLSQSLAVPAWIPIAAFGPLPGFHLFLALVTAAIPCAAACDVGSSDGRRRGVLVAAVSSIVTAGYFATVMYSGMANSTAGAAAVAIALASSHAARRGRRWGGPVLVLALTMTLYSHAAFYIYGAACLAVEAVFYRDRRGALRSAAALAIAFVAALPLHWELLRYRTWFVTNNLYFEAPPAFDWNGLARQIWYATEMLGRPDRWFNDYGGLTYVFLPVLLFVAWRDRSRTGFYAWAAIAIVVSLRLNAPQLGLVAGRQLHLLPVLVAPALAGFLAGWMRGGPIGRAALLATIALFVAVPFAKVPHVVDVTAFDPALVARIRAAEGAMVLLENNPHWDMIGDPAVRTERSRFDVHYESLLPAATGKRFFGQPQDGYHRSRFRGLSLAGGGLAGRAIGTVPHGEFSALMRRWGVKHLFVWSDASRSYLGQHPQFSQAWAEGPWREFVLDGADTRSVLTDVGSGMLSDVTAVSGRVVLHGVAAGRPVIVRTHYYPAWQATSGGQVISLSDENGQMRFDAPVTGDAIVELQYDRRTWLLSAAVASLLAGMALLARWPA
jgi:hypothetical protein